MDFVKTKGPGILIAAFVAAVSTFLSGLNFGSFSFEIIGAPVFAILIGMIITAILPNFASSDKMKTGVTFTSKKILQYAVIILGFSLNIKTVLSVGGQSLPVIISTIATSLITAFIMCKLLKMDKNVSILVGVGSSICGGSAVAATAPVIDADDEEVAQAISVIFFFNVLAALIFPVLGSAIGFNTASGEAFGIFAGTAVNDTSSVTACASTWDSMYNLGSETLDKAVTVKLTRTLAIIPITLVLSLIQARKETFGSGFSFKKSFPVFILWFIAASVITTVAGAFGVPSSVFKPLKELSKFFIILAMSAIGLNTNIVKLVKTGGKPLFMGFCCWTGITCVSLLMQHVMGLW
jgi:uncharacterized integral membrane protein (TIGR00698 family)